jgi:hypothetical protein
LWLRRFLVRFPPNAVEELNWFPMGGMGDEDGCIGVGICCSTGICGPTGTIFFSSAGICGPTGAICSPGGSTGFTGGCPGLGGGATFSGTGGADADENMFVKKFNALSCKGRASSAGSDGVELNQSAIPPPDFLRKLRCLLGFDLDLFLLCLVRMCYCLLYKI